METLPYAQSLQRKLIEEFKKKFYDKLGFYPEVITHTTVFSDTNKSTIMRIPLDELMDIFDTHILLPHIKYTPNAGWITSLRNKTRIREICEIRYMYFKVAAMMGYSTSTIGRTVGMNHSSVIHGLQRLNDHLETDIRVRQDYYSTILTVKQIIEDEYRHLQCAHQIQAESQSVVLDTLPE